METKEIGLEIVQIRLIQDRIVYNEKPIHSPQDAVEILEMRSKTMIERSCVYCKSGCTWGCSKCQYCFYGNSKPDRFFSKRNF